MREHFVAQIPEQHVSLDQIRVADRVARGRRHFRRPQMAEFVIRADRRRAFRKNLQIKAVDAGRPAVVEDVGVRARQRRGIQEKHDRVRAFATHLLKSPYGGHPVGPAPLPLDRGDQVRVQPWAVDAADGGHLVVRQALERRELLTLEILHLRHIRRELLLGADMFEPQPIAVRR